MGTDNLVPQSERTKEEQKEIARLGGIASGEARRKKKAMREWAEIIGSLPTNVKAPDGSIIEGADLDADAVMQQYYQAHKGNTKAAKFLADLKGEMVQKVDVGDARIVVVRSEEERQKIEDIGNIGA